MSFLILWKWLLLMIEVTAVVIMVVVASIGAVIAVFAKNKGPEFEIFFNNLKMVFISCF